MICNYLEKSLVDQCIVNKAKRKCPADTVCMYSEWLFQAFPKALFLNLTLLDWWSVQFLLAVQPQKEGPFSKGDKAASLSEVFSMTSHFLDVGNYGLLSVGKRENALIQQRRLSQQL